MTDIRPHDNFICYSRRDSEFVHKLQGMLQDQGLTAWVDQRDIPPTAEWMREIYLAIEAANNFIFVISPASVTSEICLKEISNAVENNKRVIPIVYRDVAREEVPEAINKLNWIFFREKDDSHLSLRSLITALTTDLEYVRAHTRILQRAVEWNSTGQDNSYLLRGSDLRNAIEWVGRSGAIQEPKLTNMQGAYIQRSQDYEVK